MKELTLIGTVDWFLAKQLELGEGWALFHGHIPQLIDVAGKMVEPYTSEDALVR